MQRISSLDWENLTEHLEIDERRNQDKTYDLREDSIDNPKKEMDYVLINLEEIIVEEHKIF